MRTLNKAKAFNWIKAGRLATTYQKVKLRTNHLNKFILEVLKNVHIFSKTWWKTTV